MKTLPYVIAAPVAFVVLMLWFYLAAIALAVLLVIDLLRLLVEKWRRKREAERVRREEARELAVEWGSKFRFN